MTLISNLNNKLYLRIIQKIMFVLTLSLFLSSCKDRQSGHSNIDLLQIEIIKDMQSSSLITVIPSSNKYVINNREMYSDNNSNLFLPNFEYISVDSTRMPYVLKLANEILKENLDTIVCRSDDLMLFNKYPLIVTFNFTYRNESKSYIILVEKSKISSSNRQEKLLMEILNNISNYSKDSMNIKYSNEIKSFFKAI